MTTSSPPMHLMEKYQDKLRLATIVLLCLVQMGFGLYARQTPLLICGAAGMAYAAVATTMRRCAWRLPGKLRSEV